MSLREEIRSLGTTRKDLVQFGLLVGAVFLLIGFLMHRKGYAPSIYVLGLGGTLVVAGALVPRLLRPVYLVWMTFALALGFVMTRVILTVFFYLLVTPVGLAMRLLGKDLLDQRLDRQAATYWKKKEYHIADRQRFEKFF